MKGQFITLEGLEGSGKSTSREHILSLLKEQFSIDPVVTREPGGTPLGEKLRGILLDPETGDLAAMTEVLMMFAIRSQHLTDVILPAINEGRWVVCDRFTDSTYAYQSGGREMPASGIATLEALVQQSFRPDLTIFLDVPPEIGLKRATQEGADRFEQEAVDFFNKARAVFLERAESDKGRIEIVDAAQPLADVLNDITRIFKRRFA